MAASSKPERQDRPHASKSGTAGRGPKAYLGHIVSPVDATTYEDIRDGALIVDEQGIIVKTGPWRELKNEFSESQVIDFSNHLILPGLVDLHLHLPQVTQTGKSGQTLLGWLEKYIFPAEARFADIDHGRKIATWFFNELAANGTTLAVVFTTIHKQACDAAFEIAAQKGNRVIMGKVMMDRNAPEALSENCETSLKESDELCRKWHGYDKGRLMYAFTPRFAVTSTQAMLEGAGKLWRSHEGSYMHTHLSESEEEVAFVARQFPEARSYVDVYGRAGLTGKRTIFAHAIHLDDADINELARTNSSLAHCPSSNFFLKSGVFPFSRVKEGGVRFGLGSDVAAGPYMSLFGVMKDANFMQPGQWITAAELFYLATLGGAKALYLDNVVGSLTAGKEADFIVVDPTRKTGIVDNILKQSTDEILSALVFLGDDRVIEATYVRGACIFERERKHLAMAAGPKEN